MLHSGKSINIVAAEQGIDRDTVTAHRDAWLSKGIDGLLDAPRSGAPRKLATEHIQLLCDWARSEALSAPQLRARLHEQHHITVSVWIVQECLRRQGFIYKRTRHSLKKSETTPLLTLLSPSWHSSKPKPKEEK
jgi:transposase